MASIDKLPSGRWRARVRRDGRQLTFTHQQKGVVQRWARDVEAKVDGGEWVAPTPSQAVSVGAFRDRWARDQRVVTPATRAKQDSVWSVHVGPRWADVALVDVTRPAVQAWVRSMDDAGAGAWTVDAAVRHLGVLLQAALDEGLVPGNPARGLRLPAAPRRAPFFWSREECAAIVVAVPAGSDRVAVDLDLHVGLRLGELLGMPRSGVDGALMHVTQVVTRAGVKPYPKSKKSARAVPVPVHLQAAVKELAQAGPRTGPLFPAPTGGWWSDRNFHRRVFAPAVAAAGVRQGSPHDMRHTAASLLVAAGVDVYRVQALLGHESVQTTMRYAHLGPSAHDVIVAAWSPGGHGGLGLGDEEGP